MMGTKEKILSTSLALFNELGERNVTTNHIAAHLNISPGNLYYHFRNKQAIIYALFKEYETGVLDVLQVPTERMLTVQDKLVYLQSIFQGLWDFRFLHRDMEHLLLADPQLHDQYQQFYRACLANITAIFKGLRRAGILAIHDDELAPLALNTWIVITSWFSFLRCNLLSNNVDTISPELLMGGIYQVFTLERPYLSTAYREPMLELQRAFVPKPAWL